MTTIRGQSVADHSWGVASVILELWPNTRSLSLIQAALYHDVAEGVLGDTPFTAKQKYPAIKTVLDICEMQEEEDYMPSLGTVETYRLKIADMLELMLWCEEEVNLGNKAARKWFNNGYDHLNKLITNKESKEWQVTSKLMSRMQMTCKSEVSTIVPAGTKFNTGTSLPGEVTTTFREPQPNTLTDGVRRTVSKISTKLSTTCKSTVNSFLKGS